MPAFHNLRRAAQGPFSTRSLLIGSSAFFLLAGLFVPLSAAQVAWAVFLGTAGLAGWVMSRGALEGISVERRHRPRVFANDPVPVTLSLGQEGRFDQTLLLVEDEFGASLSGSQTSLIPLMTPRWEARLHYQADAERNRGLYLVGPIRLCAADPLGVFHRFKEIACITRLTVYPRPFSLKGYRFLAPRPRFGPGLDTHDRIGQGEEIISVRPYRGGDPPSRIHWRTSMRRRELHVMELDSQVLGEAVIFIDLTRRADFGGGAQSTSEVAISCATSILSEASAMRHLVGIALVRDKVEHISPDAGLRHLHLLLDRLAVLKPGGEVDFWRAIEPVAAKLAPGSKAIYIAPAATTPPEEACALVRRLALAGVAQDVILLDESQLLRFWRDQAPRHRDSAIRFDSLRAELELAGARVLPLARGQTAASLLPRAAEPASRLDGARVSRN